MKRGFVTGNVMLAVLCCASMAFAGAGDPNYVLSISAGSGATGDSFTSTVSLDNSMGGDVQGWSFGVCNDPAALTVDASELGATSLVANNGTPVEFEQRSIFADGATMGVVICFTGCAVLTPASGQELLDITYTITGSQDTTLSCCNTLGMPPVSTVVVVMGASIAPVCADTVIDVVDPNQLAAGSATGLLGSTVDTAVSLNNVNLAAVDAAQISMSYDPGIVSVNTVSNTVGANFFDSQDNGAGELVIGLVMDTASPIDQQIPAGPSMTDLATITWNGDAVGSSALALVDGLGMPPITNGVVMGAGSLYSPSLVDGSVTIVNFNPFIRSDCNSSGNVDIGDGVYGLNYLFQMGPDPVCDDACDSNDDGTIDASDCIHIFNFQFLDGPAPLAPYPSADLDPTQGDGLGCNGDADDIP